MKAITKVAFSLFKKHLVRFITIMAIVVVSVGFVSGVGELEGKIKTATNEVYVTQNVSDLYLKSKNQTGFTQDELSIIEDRFGVENTLKSFCYETMIEDDSIIARVHSFNLESEINRIELKSGSLPTAYNEIAVERGTQTLKGFEVGESVVINGATYVVTGIVYNSYYFGKGDEPSYQYTDENISCAIYLNGVFSPIVNDVYVKLNNSEDIELFDADYEKIINNQKTEVVSLLGEDNVEVLSLYENYGYYSAVNYAEKVGIIGIVFVIFFLLVTLLVVYSTMSRLLIEERSQIACQKTLGYTDYQILFKYVLFVFIATFVGGALAFPVGLGLVSILYQAFNMQYVMPAFPASPRFFYYLVTLVVIVLATVLLTFITGKKLIKEKPATLLTPKAPKSGKVIFLERIGVIWNRLSFKYKSTLRNIFLFKSRLFMTVVSIMGSCVLVFCGIGLLNCTTSYENAGMIKAIAVALIAFSAVLCLLVIYNLTNINVSERNREIATLMVLGYQKNEVSGYMFREIYIMAIFGALLGVPLGVLFINFVFGLISFGTLSDIAWWTYLITPCITVLFSFLSTLLLRKKINNTDMNASLKSVE